MPIPKSVLVSCFYLVPAPRFAHPGETAEKTEQKSGALGAGRQARRRHWPDDVLAQGRF